MALASPPGADALATMNERSVCRSYRPDAVPEELFRLLCATGLAAPTKSDLQQADIVRIRSPEKRTAINALLPGSPWIPGAPEFLVFCGDGFRFRHLFDRRGIAFANDHLDAFFNAAVDGAIVLATFVQAAELAGLGSCPISEIRNHAATISALLELPDRVFPIAGLTLGYPATKEPMSPRLGLDATVHVERYRVEQVDAELERYDVRRVRDRPYTASAKWRSTSRISSHERWTTTAIGPPPATISSGSARTTWSRTQSSSGRNGETTGWPSRVRV